MTSQEPEHCFVQFTYAVVPVLAVANIVDITIIIAIASSVDGSNAVRNGRIASSSSGICAVKNGDTMRMHACMCITVECCIMTPEWT